MSDIAVSIENVRKYYRLGTIGNRTLYQDLNRWWARMRGQPDPLLKIGEAERSRGGQGGLWALDDVSLEIRQGDVLGIIGHNGAGKSTLLKILSRVTGPTSGQIRVRGRIASLLEVGTGFHPDLTGRENIYLNGAILGMTKAEIRRKFDEIVAFADVEKFIDTPVKRYSSGMYVRLAFAVAAHLDPEILVVDEVLAVGDLAFQEKCIGKMGEASREGRTVLFVSHNLQSIWSLCKTTVWMNRGRVEAQGAVGDVLNLYRRSVRQVSGIDLNDVARAGSGKLRIKSLEILNSKGEENGVVQCGESANIRLVYEVADEARADNLQLNIGLTDSRHTRLLTLSNRLTGDRFVSLEKTGVITCSIPKVPLVPGEYELNVACQLGPELTDKFKVPRSFVVSEGRFHEDGEILGEAFGSLMIDHRWSVGDQNER